MKVELSKDELSVILDSLQLLSKKDEELIRQFNTVDLNQTYNKLYTARENEFQFRA